MSARVNFAFQDLFSTAHSERGNLGTKLLPGAIDFLIDLGFGGSDDSFAFSLGVVLGFLDELASTFLGLGQNFTGLLTRLLQLI